MAKPSNLVTRISDNSDCAEEDDLWAEDSDYGISDRQLEELALGWQKHSRERTDFDAGGDEGPGGGAWTTLLAHLSRLQDLTPCSSVCSTMPCTSPHANAAPRTSSRHKETVESMSSISGARHMSQQAVDEYLELVTKEEEVRFHHVPRPPLQVEYFQLDKDNGEAVDKLPVSSSCQT
ncbi:unnamed protein product [Symbiodinium natans]|uniref:Uncharacterized protein n=1 Tax=Symbiodinium natans TaxID=878477 RepID=A0A812M6K1_9DINO|nr:unnamed protein product [Symbiodinium natans]